MNYISNDEMAGSAHFTKIYYHILFYVNYFPTLFSRQAYGHTLLTVRITLSSLFFIFYLFCLGINGPDMADTAQSFGKEIFRL